MSTLQNLRDQISINIGGRSDPTALSIIDAAVNFAATLSSLLHRPPELMKESQLSFVGNATSVSLGGISNWLDILVVFNQTDNKIMRFIPYELLDTILATLTTTKYYSIYGIYLYLRKSPTATKTLLISHMTYPTKLVNVTDALDFAHHDAYIISIASGLAFSALEENDSAAMWQKVSDVVSQGSMLGRQAREVIAGQQAYFEAIVSQAKGA